MKLAVKPFARPVLTAKLPQLLLALGLSKQEIQRGQGHMKLDLIWSGDWDYLLHDCRKVWLSRMKAIAPRTHSDSDRAATDLNELWLEIQRRVGKRMNQSMADLMPNHFKPTATDKGAQL